MTALSRRAFIGTSSALALAWGIPRGVMGSALAQPLEPNIQAPTTLNQTILQRSVAQKNNFHTLLPFSGEPYLPRFDVLGKSAKASRANSRRSLAYLGHMTDIHIQDTQSPARLQAAAGSPEPNIIPGGFRPQEALTIHVQAAMLATINAAKYSPVTGAPMAALLNTGDTADQHSELELQWSIQCMDGLTVTPNSGAPGVYDGPQVWDDATYAFHPDGGPGNTRYDDYGFPLVPGMMTAAVSEPVPSQGSPVPWYTTYGNHDTLYNGVFPIDPALQSLAVGQRKAVTWQALLSNSFEGWANDPTVFTRLENTLKTQFGQDSGSRTVPSDPGRKLFEQAWFMQAHFDTPDKPGPVGHGFTQNNLDTGETWYKADIGPNLRLFGLDTCNQVMGADGAVPEDQFIWLEGELAQAKKDNVLCMILSHHNSLTLENGALSVFGPNQRLIHAEEFVSMLHKYPNMIAWVNGHTHINTIIAHPKPDGDGGFWEVTTASCIDFPQQQQMFEIVDNQDGTMSIFTTVLDHLSPPTWEQDDLSVTGLASLSRTLAANDWFADPLMRRGSAYDRNCELLLPAPFDLSQITDAQLEKTNAARAAALIAGEMKTS